jgi:hypothetical protein
MYPNMNLAIAIGYLLHAICYITCIASMQIVPITMQRVLAAAQHADGANYYADGTYNNNV